MGRIRRDLTGQTFGELTGIKPIGSNRSGHTVWLFHCSCGTIFHRDVQESSRYSQVGGSCEFGV